MPFGLKMLQDVFQAKIDQTFEGCEGTIGIADDIVIFGKSEQEHDHHLHGMLARCRNYYDRRCKLHCISLQWTNLKFGLKILLKNCALFLNVLLVKYNLHVSARD